jgi:predicted RND superfamily exporter protein
MKLQDVLMKLAKFEEHHYKLILVVFLFLTLIVSSGMYYLKVQSDLNKSFPQDLDYFVTSDKVTEKFGGQDTILVLVELDGNYSSSDAVLDIRDPEVTGFISTLSKKMSEESDIDSVTSIYTLFNIIDNFCVKRILYYSINCIRIKSVFISRAVFFF